VIASLTGQGNNVRHACRFLGVTESGYYAWRSRPTSPRALRRIFLAGQITEVHRDSAGVYGAHRITAELRFGRQVIAGHNAVAAIMRELGLKGLPNRRLPRGARVGRVGGPDLVRREFAREAPDELWMTDITEHPTREGKIYCCVVLNAYSRRVVGWSIDTRQTTVLVTNALGMATRRRDPAGGLVIHSDRGVQPEFKRSSQRCRLTGRMVVASSDARSDVVAGSAVGGAVGGSAAVLAGDRGWVLKRGRGHGGGRVASGWQPVVPRRWRYAANLVGPGVGALSVVR
jgi:putative transposase